MAKSNSVEKIIEAVGLVTGLTFIIIACVVGSYLLTAWIGDIVYSNIFEEQGIGPTISYWQMLGVTIAIKMFFRGFNFTTKKD